MSRIPDGISSEKAKPVLAPESGSNLLTQDNIDNMKERGNCRDCGNPWWFDLATCWVCSMCRKTHGKDSSEWRKE